MAIEISQTAGSRVSPRLPASGPSAVTADGVSITYPLERGDSLVAVERVSFDVVQRAFVSLIGPSGCGKSTLLRAIGDLNLGAVVSGDLRVNGRSPLEARRDNEFAFVFQDPVLLPWRTVQDNVALPLELRHRAQHRDRARDPRELLELVGLAGFERALPKALSGGMRQRVSIARALTIDPSVLLMDEPFGALDEISRERMNLELLKIWAATTASVMFVTHSIAEAVFLSDFIIVMTSRPGRIRAVVDVPLPRPRESGLKRTVEFLELENTVRDALGA